MTQSGVSHDTLQHPHHPSPRVCWCQVYLCHMSLCFIFFSCVTEVESVSGYTGPSFDGGRGSIRPFLYKPLKVIFLVSGTKGKYHKRIGKITYFMANVWQRGVLCRNHGMDRESRKLNQPQQSEQPICWRVSGVENYSNLFYTHSAT